MFEREIEKPIKKDFFKGKALIIVGARQTGKTSLVEKLIKNSKYESKTISFNCDFIDDREQLNNVNLTRLEKVIGKHKIVFIDEGQKVQTIGQTLKILVDHYKKEKQIIVTGSSSLNLLDRTEEPLTGRKFVFRLYPLSIREIYLDKDLYKIHKELEEYLIFGSYPDVVNNSSFKEKTRVLKELTSSNLYKDILEFQSVKSSSILVKLLKLLSLQIGKEVSYHEISSTLGIDLRTIERYVDLLEKNFIVFRLPPYSMNKRREISRMNKIYFYDLGIRNALISNFNLLENRNDIGELFENFMITERLKYREYNQIYGDQYFWRTYDGSEVDLVEDRNGKLFGYEFKWKEKKWGKKPVKWLEYKNSSYNFITRDNLEKFIL